MISYTLDEIYDENMCMIEVVNHPKQVVQIKVKEPICAYYLMRIKRY